MSEIDIKSNVASEKMAGEVISKYVSKIWPATPVIPNLDNIQIDFLGDFVLEKNELIGLDFNGLYIPEEIMLNIFANLSPQDILRCSLVCKNWFNIAKSNALWQKKYNEKEYPKKAKNLPWYIFYCYFTTDNFKNLLKNGNGEEKFKYWNIMVNGGDKFVVQKEPAGSDPLPENVPEFHGHTSCFATSFDNCLKYQRIDLKSKRLLRHIIRKYRPSLYLSEWYTGRFDCSCIYKLTVACDTKERKWKVQESSRPNRRRHRRELPPTSYCKSVEGQIEQWASKPWEKLELICDDYPEDIESICFCHEGKDLQFWAGHYGSKMAGGVVKFVFDSIEPAPEDMCESGDV